MKKLFIYYSLSGNGDNIADYLKDKVYDIRKVITEEELPKNNMLRILIGGYKAMINYKDKLKKFDYDISSYDEIVIGSPIWNSRLSSPINTVLDNINLDNKKITFILYSGSGKTNRATDMLNKKYSSANIINLCEPKKNISELEKVGEL